MIHRPAAVLVLLSCLLAAGCNRSAPSLDDKTAEAANLVGAWRAKVTFKSGALAEVKDLEFLYSFNLGGTMTESSNYDSVPPVPPAYGVWRRTGAGQFEAKYIFYMTKPPANFEELAKGSGWLPAGSGTLTEKIKLSPDGRTFTSTIKFEIFDPAGSPAEGGGDGSAEAARIEF